MSLLLFRSFSNWQQRKARREEEKTNAKKRSVNPFAFWWKKQRESDVLLRTFLSGWTEKGDTVRKIIFHCSLDADWSVWCVAASRPSSGKSHSLSSSSRGVLVGCYVRPHSEGDRGLAVPTNQNGAKSDGDRPGGIISAGCGGPKGWHT